LIDEAFCLIGLLKGAESFQRVVCLLPPGRRDTILQLAAELAALPVHELQNRLFKLTDAAALQVKERISKCLGVGWVEVSPLLQRWLGEMALRTHGS
jgi:hypothetical protein